MTRNEDSGATERVHRWTVRTHGECINYVSIPDARCTLCTPLPVHSTSVVQKGVHRRSAP